MEQLKSRGNSMQTTGHFTFNTFNTYRMKQLGNGFKLFCDVLVVIIVMIS